MGSSWRGRKACGDWERGGREMLTNAVGVRMMSDVLERVEAEAQRGRSTRWLWLGLAGWTGREEREGMEIW